MKKQGRAEKCRRTRQPGRTRPASPAHAMTASDRHRALQLFLRMAALPGTSGCEGPVAEFIRKKLHKAGAALDAVQSDQAHRRSPRRGEVGNLVCRFPGTRRKPRRLLMAHIDTVPLCEGAKPVVRGNRVVPADERTALGADDRSGAAVVLFAAMEILRRDLPHPPMTFFWTVQEELGLYGVRHARLGMLGKPRLAFNFDGGSPEKLTIGATGGYRMEIEVRGVASHAGAAPEDGVSAIAIASLAIADLHRQGWHGQILKNGRAGTSNVGVIRGGEATNVVTPLVEVNAEARSHDPDFRKTIVRAIEDAFTRAARSVRNTQGKRGQARVRGRLDYEAFQLSADEPCVLVAEEAVLATGGEPVRAVCNGGVDANWMTHRGIPTVTLGCGHRNPHTTAEQLDLPQFYRACSIALRLAGG